MKYFIDTEFIEYPGAIDLISLGIVSRDDRELYLINKDCDLTKANSWVVANVLEKMPQYDRCSKSFLSGDLVKSKGEIVLLTESFVTEANPQFWGYFCDYDWVAFCQIFGGLVGLPRYFPQFCMDLAQLVCTYLNEHNIDVDNKLTRLGVPDNNNAHNAFLDAKWIKNAYEIVETKFF